LGSRDFSARRNKSPPSPKIVEEGEEPQEVRAPSHPDSGSFDRDSLNDVRHIFEKIDEMLHC
jgi:hypothetical protein